MNKKKLATIGIMIFTFIVPVSLTGCFERDEKVEYHRDVDSGPVVVPEKGDIDVNVHTDTDKK